MIDLYAAGTSNGMRARIALEECGLPYELHPVDLAKGEHKTPQFLAMNPNGRIPVIEGLPNVARWAGEMTARPAIQRALRF